MLTIEKIIHAQRVLEEAIYKTDVIRTSKLTDECELYLKAENLQKTGSFKIRGAYYKISRLSPEEKKRGVIACSAGNHAQGVALAAQKNGISALICLPEGAPISKVEATRGYGAELCLVPGVYDDAYNRALQLQQERGLTFIHPFDDEDVIAGQGTIGLEILSQVKDIDAVVVPVGGGGLISGVAFAVKQLNPKVQVYGVQASGAASMVTSLHDGKIECLPSVSTIADGIAVKQPGEHTYDYCKQYVDGIVTVTDEEICAAILALIEKRKMIAEGAGATGRQYRRDHFKPCDHPRACDERQTMHPQHCAFGQARAARRRVADHRRMRRERRRRSSRTRQRGQRGHRVLPAHRYGDAQLRAHCRDPKGIDGRRLSDLRLN